ncbi:hypothetical protein [uncultured Mucilaginibacter sp.]|uniref:hypothetical protein n=1 Tax=uncultured Mucilaginibacter sp. TaxID=797541 RepID=UPI0025E0DF11|nr:hypothetical protein [uncultured Mucilaginibacter sp.]
MKSVTKGSEVLKPVLIIAIILFTVFQSKGQQSKPAESGYVPVNGIKVYYEVMVRVSLSFCCMVLL